MRLTLKQKKFADEYIISGNIFRSLVEAGYSENYAKARGHEMLENVGVKAYIEERLKEGNASNLLTMEEALEITSSIARGQPRNVSKINEETGEKENVETYPSFSDSQKALEHFYRINGAFIEKKEINANIPVIITGDRALED